VPEILMLCPQERDFRAIRAADLDPRYRVRFAGSDLDELELFDPDVLLDEFAALPVDGVAATKDRSALLAALLAERRGLRGPTPQALIACQHKPTSRQIQHRTAPAATPSFELLDGRPPSFAPPWFVKPVIGRLSQGARRVDELADLAGIREAGTYQDGYAQIGRLAGLPTDQAHGFLVEQFVTGAEVTLEGYVFEGRVTTIGVTDSVKYPGTDSFERFEYPSALREERLRELAGIAERLLPALGFDNGFFNVEFFVPRDLPAWTIEINGRLASQFAPLVQAVHGRSTYEALVRLACGEDPQWSPGAANGVAISYALRAVQDAEVVEVPEAAHDLEVLVRPGLRLSEQGTNDPQSYRLAIFSEWGRTRDEALTRCRERAAALPFVLK
jgi:hypothetical protein